MQFLFSTFRDLCRQRIFIARCRGRTHTRSISRSFEARLQATAPAEPPSGRVPSVPDTCANFEDLGLHPPIIAAFRSAFPNVTHPTESQTKFIPAILSGRDVLLKDETGSGKSFGLVFALLSKPRLIPKDGGKVPSYITSLVLVPHRDLAYQLYHWIERAAASSPESVPSMSSLAQVLVRNGTSHLTEGLRSIRHTPPHILIGTPQAVMDVYKEDPEALQIPHLSSVVVDEVDYLIETVPKKDPNRSFHKATLKATKKLAMHPGVTRELLDIIFAKRKEINGRRKDEAGVTQHRRRTAVPENMQSSSGSPQLILSSATLRRHLNNYLFEESGWLDTDRLLKVKGVVKEASGAHDQRLSVKYTHDGLGGSGILHSVLLVSDQKIRNIEGAAAGLGADDNGDMQVIDAETLFRSSATGQVAVENDATALQKYRGTESPFNPNALEAVATAFALGVPSIALLVLPSSSSVQRAVYELREMGVNAHGLDLLVGEKGRSHLLHGVGTGEETPTVLVSTIATTRGLDLPALSHVFILGIPEGPKITGRAVDAYVHLAGRVGRFGRGGRVVTIVEESAGVGGVSEGEKMDRILQTIRARAVRLEHFD